MQRYGKTVGDLLGDNNQSIYTEFNPVTNLMIIDYEEHQEDWEALFFKSKEQQRWLMQQVTQMY